MVNNHMFYRSVRLHLPTTYKVDPPPPCTTVKCCIDMKAPVTGYEIKTTLHDVLIL